MKKTLSTLLLASCITANEPVPDTRLRFSAFAEVNFDGLEPCSAAVRVEDLGSQGSPTPDPRYRNRWHYVITGCTLPTSSRQRALVFVCNFEEGYSLVWIQDLGFITYTAQDIGLRPGQDAAEVNEQFYSITRLGALTYDLVIDEPR